jgi:hypothetical protein
MARCSERTVGYNVTNALFKWRSVAVECESANEAQA